jgi:hypothetical protein
MKVIIKDILGTVIAAARKKETWIGSQITKQSTQHLTLPYHAGKR